MADPTKGRNEHPNADLSPDGSAGDENNHLPHGATSTVDGNQMAKTPDGTQFGAVTWFPGKIPNVLNRVDPQVAPPTEVQNDRYLLEDATAMDVDSITWISGTLVEVVFNGGPALPAVNDFIHFTVATNASNNGSFKVTVSTGPATIRFENPARTDATDDEASDSPAIGQFTLADWDGAPPNAWVTYDNVGSVDTWRSIAAQESNDVYNKTSQTNWFYNGNVWIEELLSTAGLMELIGDIDASTNPNYPSGNKGDAHVITVAGKIGGASGKVVAVGDLVVAKADNPGGDEATVGVDWFVLEANLDLNGTPTFGKGLILTEEASIPDTEGLLSYVDKSLVLKTDIPGSTQSVGQEFWIRVINKTGVSIPDGSLVYVSGLDAASGRITIALAKADVEATSNVLGFSTNTMANNAEGFVTVIGFLNDLDTSSFSAGDELFLSDTVAGGVTTTKPLNAIPVGFVTKVNASTGQILTTIARKIVDSPLFAQLSDSTNQKPTTTSPQAVTFNTNDDIRGITHSIVSATEDIIIPVPGTYTPISQPQVERTSGASAQTFHMWARIGAHLAGGVSSVSVADPSVITTDAPHGLTTGQTVEITNVVTTPDINAPNQHVITVIDPTTFTIPVNVTVVTDGVGDWRNVLDSNDDLANSNVELRISGSNDSDVIPLIFTRDFVANEKINIMQSVSVTGNGIGLVVINPAGEPRIPSIIFALNKN